MTEVRVLVIEDEEPLADSIKYNLELEGYGVDVAHAGFNRRVGWTVRSTLNMRPSLLVVTGFGGTFSSSSW